MPVLKQLYRQGHLRLLLLFPDGSRRIVPVEWTDAATGGGFVPPDDLELVADARDLLRLRFLVDALLRRSESEEHHATAPELSGNPETARPTMATTRRSNTSRGDRATCKADRAGRARSPENREQEQ